jgi:beta-lactamase class A
VDLATLKTLLIAEAARIPGAVSVHVRLDHGGSAGVDEGEAKPAASLIKLPIMVVLEDAWARGLLKRTARDEEAVHKAITVSDNPSADWLISRLGTSQINEWLKEHGYAHTRLKHRLEGPRPDGPNLVSAQDMTRMLLEIADGKLISPEASAHMRGLLLAQTRRTRLPAELPQATPVGNKTGTLRGIVNDAAFVEPPGGPRYAIAVLVTKAGSDTATSRAIARLSRKVYEAVTHTASKP